MCKKLKKCYVITNESNKKAFIVNEGNLYTRISNGIEDYELLKIKIIKL